MSFPTIDNNLFFKRAEAEDVDLLFTWINDPEVRAQSLSNHTIAYPEHCNWVKKKLSDKNCYLYIVYKNDIPVGMVRFDVEDDGCTISYLVDPLQRGKGIGVGIINNGIKQFILQSCFSGIIKAVVKRINFASIRIFEKAGFTEEMLKGDLFHFKKLVE